MSEKWPFSSIPARRSPRGSMGWVGVVIGPTFLLLAAWFVWGPDLAEIPEFTTEPFDPSELSTEPRLTPLGDPPIVEVNGFDQTCMNCHRLFPPRDVPPGAELMQHTHIVLTHGINDRCRNCHDIEDRDMLRLQSGEKIPYARVVELCSKCHGPTYRDWSRGMHGRTNGYWNASLGEVNRLGCTACHDPHAPQGPAMDPVRPLPAPNTLRAASTGEAAVHVGDDPLRRAFQEARHAAQAAEQAHEAPGREETE
jgi:hypothetical protein